MSADRLSLRGGVLALEQPVLMGIVNATPDSFSDVQRPKELDELVELAERLAADGAEIIDVGGESGRTDRPVVAVEEEARRVVPLVDRLANLGLTVSVDTWRGPVARAALDAGAAMINDVSGLSDPSVADACAEAGAALVVTHTRSAPKQKAYPSYDDVVDDVLSFLAERAGEARAHGVPDEAIVLDPGVDLAKTPADSVAVLRRLDEVRALGRPLLLALSRKDFIGVITGRAPVGAARRNAGGRGRGDRGARVDPAGARRGRGARLPRRPRRAARRARALAGAAAGRGAAAGAGVTPFRIAQLSDPHCGAPHFVPELLDRAIEEVNELSPGRGGGLGRPHERRPAGGVRARGRVPGPDRLRAGDRDPRQPRLAQRGLRALRGAVRRAPLGAARRTGCRSWRWTPPSPTSTTG